MRPPNKSNIEYERIKQYDEWIPGTIETVQLEENRLTGFKDEKTGEPKRADMVRFKFALKDHDFPHYSRWMSYSFGEKSNLFKKYLSYLVESAQPDMDFDLDDLKGFEIKTMWIKNPKNEDFDNLEQIRPLGQKCKKTVWKSPDPDENEPPEEDHDEGLPF